MSNAIELKGWKVEPLVRHGRTRFGQLSLSEITLGSTTSSSPLFARQYVRLTGAAGRGAAHIECRMAPHDAKPDETDNHSCFFSGSGSAAAVATRRRPRHRARRLLWRKPGQKVIQKYHTV
jgi:hypothetical protein